MLEQIFKNKRINLQKLIDYGFEPDGNMYIYKLDIKELELRLKLTFDEKINVEVTDLFSGEEYVLYKIPNATGEFVGKVRCEIETVLTDISDKCFEDDVFKTPVSKEVIAYTREIYGDELEFLWETDPDCAVLRRQDSGKWYGVIMKVPRSKFGFESDEKCEIMNLHATSEDVLKLVDNKRIFPAFHMNKKYWISLILEEFDNIDEICSLIDESYRLAKK